jgi:hypothetical protein
LTAVGLVGLWAGISLTAPRWSRLFRQPVASATEDEVAAEAAPPRAGAKEADEARRTIKVKLFFETPDRPGLVMEERSVGFDPDISGQIRIVVEELIRGSQSGLLSPLNPAARVLEVFVSARGIAYLDLSRDVGEGLLTGSDAELRAVYSIVNTITVNFPAVRKVQILVDDRPAATLAGHVDLSRPLAPDMTLLAAAALTPVTPSPDPGTAPPS